MVGRGGGGSLCSKVRIGAKFGAAFQDQIFSSCRQGGDRTNQPPEGPRAGYRWDADPKLSYDNKKPKLASGLVTGRPPSQACHLHSFQGSSLELSSGDSFCFSRETKGCEEFFLVPLFYIPTFAETDCHGQPDFARVPSTSFFWEHAATRGEYAQEGHSWASISGGGPDSPPPSPSHPSPPFP